MTNSNKPSIFLQVAEETFALMFDLYAQKKINVFCQLLIEHASQEYVLREGLEPMPHGAEGSTQENWDDYSAVYKFEERLRQSIYVALIGLSK